MCNKKDLRIRPISNGFIITKPEEDGEKEIFAQDVQDALYTLSVFLVDPTALIKSELSSKENCLNTDQEHQTGSGLFYEEKKKYLIPGNGSSGPDLSKILLFDVGDDRCALCGRMSRKGSSTLEFEDKEYNVHTSCKRKLYYDIEHPKCFICEKRTRSDGVRFVKN